MLCFLDVFTAEKAIKSLATWDFLKSRWVIHDSLEEGSIFHLLQKEKKQNKTKNQTYMISHVGSKNKTKTKQPYKQTQIAKEIRLVIGVSG